MEVFMKQLYIISYDISDDGIRRKIEKTLCGYGLRVQFSVFESIVDRENYLLMKKRITEISKSDKFNMGKDSVRFYTVCNTCKEKIACIGSDIGINENYYIV